MERKRHRAQHCNTPSCNMQAAARGLCARTCAQKAERRMVARGTRHSSAVCPPAALLAAHASLNLCTKTQSDAWWALEFAHQAWYSCTLPISKRVSECTRSWSASAASQHKARPVLPTHAAERASDASTPTHCGKASRTLGVASKPWGMQPTDIWQPALQKGLLAWLLHSATSWKGHTTEVSGGLMRRPHLLLQREHTLRCGSSTRLTALRCVSGKGRERAMRHTLECRITGV